MKINNIILYTLVIIFCCAFSIKKDKKVNVYLVGDSTVCSYGTERAPLTGWGMPFANYFNSSVTIKNQAKGGRSTRTFISEGLWKSVYDSLQVGDFVLIQFGHNDEAKQPEYADRYTPVNDYKNNLLKLIAETRSRQAIPILITPVSRMNFDKNGTALETHTEYSAAMKDVAEKSNTVVIDLDKQSRELYQNTGPLMTKYIFMTLDSGEHPNYPNGSHDNTHFSEYGARLIAEIILKQLTDKHVAIASEIVDAKKNKSNSVAGDVINHK
ncbi:rhamnogalacturonan acetylesterase [Pedobacter aquatilis]|uniref:rhamnogalacturonan acetylesterase n=1 Tax=Pedobacter aquatilis TaxID=351343 RepID=UPI00292D445F|nr:rhamnogalacturonan acetylesterase [Pedobacter aquatilis]